MIKRQKIQGDSSKAFQKADNEGIAALGQRIIQALAGFSELKKIVLFSSLSRRAGWLDSDIDVALEASRRLTPAQRVTMVKALALAFERPVDLDDLKSAGQPLLTQIMTTGKQLLGSDNQWAKIIYRNIMDSENFVPLQRRILIARQKAWINR